MKVKGAKALAARIRNSVRIKSVAVSNPEQTEENDLSFDPFDHLTKKIVRMSEDGEFDFLDPLNSDACRKPDFELIFSHQMMVEFGAENGSFLFERYKAGKVSPRMGKQIEAIREYTAGVYRRQYLTNNGVVLDTVAQLYRTAYNQGGLGQVDQAIATLNDRLRLSGSRFGFGPGTACMEGDNGTTEWIAVIFSDLDKEEFIALEWCHLQNNPAL
jgi:hypothetical protein